MNPKEILLKQTRSEIGLVCSNVELELVKLNNSLEKRKKNFNSLSPEQKIVENKLIPQAEKKVEELGQLKNSPYFSKLDFDLESDKKHYELCIGKFSCGKENIYSWTTPIAALRFETPGEVKYFCPGNVLQKAKLHRKDQLMIVDKKLRFLATEAINQPRKLIYQEHFSNRKTGFMLPEIIAEMEKAQDQVIRAHHIGPFLISGPAGSGKTTLALHRVAYLLQSPDLSKIYDTDSVIVFVQDNGTKEYFSKLLPELGIENVLITTFSEWAISILGLGKIKYAENIAQDELQQSEYKYAKLEALRKSITPSYNKNIYSLLRNFYSPFFSNSQKNLFERQAKSMLLDRIDLTILLQAFKYSNGFLGIIKDYYVQLRNGTFKKKHGLVQQIYSLAVIDEFQNYLPEELKLIKACINKKVQSIVYVGDMAQQVRLGTIKSWESINELIAPERQVVLKKVYRNTKNILRYLNSLGYDTVIPDSLKEGLPVVEKELDTIESKFKYINRTLTNKEYISAGVLTNNYDLLEEFKNAFKDSSKIHVMSMNEAQGVEFDVVFLIDLNHILNNQKTIEYSLSALAQEETKIDRDLAYVALTRAISELHIINS